MIVIDVKKDFAKIPRGRYKSDGVDSAEELRDDILLKHIKESDQQICLDFTGVGCLSLTFVDELFGGLVRVHDFSLEELNRRLVLKADESVIYKNLARAYEFMRDAQRHKEKTTKAISEIKD